MADREKLIELLQDATELMRAACLSHASCTTCANVGMYDCQTPTVADHLIANGVTVQKWIPVTERLPEDDRQVLACTKHGRAFSAHYDHKWKRWQVSHSVKITHWMPLPEPPKGE